MNENNYFNANGDSIGTDPSVIPVIETLDVLPTEPPVKGKKNKPNGNDSSKKPSLIKKILFTIVVLLLMAGVAFGVYYYLNLGTKNAGNVNFTLSDKVIYAGEDMSNSIMDYGDFNTVDITKCTLDISGVNSLKEGEYSYSVTCGTAKKTAKIFVKEKTVFDVAAKVVYKVAGASVEALDFIETEREDYSFSFSDDAKVNSYLESAGGPYSVDVVVTNEKYEETIVSTLLYVIPEKASLYLTCSQKNSENTIIDKFAFDSLKENMDYSIRMYEYKFNNDSDYEMAKSKIVDGQITIDNKTGYALIDNINKKMIIVSILTIDTLNSEYGGSLPTAYGDINKYYRNTKGYTCSI